MVGFKKKLPLDPPIVQIPRAVYDFEFCKNTEELKICVASINANGYRLLTVTGNSVIGHTVFFSRFAYG